MSDVESDNGSRPEFVGDRPRFRTIKLEWPVRFDGRVYDTIHVVRMTAGEVAAFEAMLEERNKTEPDVKVRWPLFKDSVGEAVPDAVLDYLDDDDKFEVDKAALDFLPRRYRRPDPTDAQPGNGEPTGPSSSGK